MSLFTNAFKCQINPYNISDFIMEVDIFTTKLDVTSDIEKFSAYIYKPNISCVLQLLITIPI